MFVFAFSKLPKAPSNWKIIINDHEIPCSRSNAEIISKKILDFISSQKMNYEEKKSDIFFKTTIPQFDDSLFCSESEYQIFNDIFNLVPIRITVVNKEVLKVLAKELEIEELSKIIKMFEEAYDLITNDEIIRLEKEICNELISLTNDNFYQVLNYIQNICNNDDSIIDNELLSSIILTVCLVKAEKIELLMEFLIKFDEKTNNKLLTYFKCLLMDELKDNLYSNEIHFIIRHLYNIKIIDKNDFCDLFSKKITPNSIDLSSLFQIIFTNEIPPVNLCNIRWIDLSFSVSVSRFEKENIYNILFPKEKLSEYSKTGSSPENIYQAIKNDDIDSFTQILSQNSAKMIFNDTIKTLVYERHSELVKYNLDYLTLSAFYGSEKIFKYILMNSGPEVLNVTVTKYAFVGGKVEIIHKCIENIQMNLGLVFDCLLLTIKHHHYELFEWLIETYEPFSKNSQKNLPGHLTMKNFDETSFLEYSLRYYNFNALFYLISIGIDCVPLFSLSMLFNNYYLANLSIKLQYNCNTSCKYMKLKNNSPFLYKYNEIKLFFFNLNFQFLLPFIRIRLILLKLLLIREILM